MAEKAKFPRKFVACLESIVTKTAIRDSSFPRIQWWRRSLTQLSSSRGSFRFELSLQVPRLTPGLGALAPLGGSRPRPCALSPSVSPPRSGETRRKTPGKNAWQKQTRGDERWIIRVLCSRVEPPTARPAPRRRRPPGPGRGARPRASGRTPRLARGPCPRPP